MVGATIGGSETREECCTLHHACRAGRSDLAHWMLGYANRAVDDVDEDGDTPLICACRGGHQAVVRVLLHHGASIDEADVDGATPLHCAAGKGHFGVAGILIHHGADVDGEDDDGASPLHYASREGHATAARLLLLHNADVGKGDIDGYSPLHYACDAGHEGVVRNLLIFGAGRMEEPSSRTYTPLQGACQHGHGAVARLLIDCEAYSGDASDRDDQGATPLHYASTEGVARLLLECGAGVDDADDDGATPLHYASWGNHEAVARLLLEGGADVDKRSGYRVIRQGSPLDWARRNKSRALEHLLLRWLDLTREQRRGILRYRDRYWLKHFLEFTNPTHPAGEGRMTGKQNELGNLPQELLRHISQHLSP